MRACIPLLLVCALAAADPSDPAWLARLLPALNQHGLADLARVPGAARGELDADLDPTGRGLIGRLTLRWVNMASEPAADLQLNAWANAPAFAGASLTLSDAMLDGMPAVVEPLDGGERLRLAFPRPVPPGASILLTARVNAAISPGRGYHGLMARSPDGVWVLSAFVPEPNVRIAGAWREDRLAGHADALRTPVSHWLIRLRVPADAAVAGPGSELSRRRLDDGRDEVELAAPLARNLCVVVGAGLVEQQRRTADGVVVRSWHRPAMAAAAARVLGSTVAAVEHLGAAFGPYPWREIDAVEAPLDGGVGGVEATGLYLVGRDMCELAASAIPSDGPPNGLAERMLEEIAAHETAHQWWHLMVGSDAMRNPWLDEAVTEWAGVWVMERRHGAAMVQPWGMCLFGALGGGMRGSMLLPAGGYDDDSYGGVVYARGALMYQHLRRQLGDERWLAALRDWTDGHRFGWAEPEDWHAWLGRHAPPELVREVSVRWLAGEGLTPADLTRAAQ